MLSIDLEKPVLFLEFYLREVSYYGKDAATKFPAHTLFYMGKSLASPYHYPQSVARYHTYKFGNKKVFGFQDGRPCLVNEPHSISYFQEQIQKKQRLDTVWLQGEEFYTDAWYRRYDQIKFSYSHQLAYLDVAKKSPLAFNVLEVEGNGRFITNFPRKEITYRLEVGQTYLFICRQEEFQAGEWSTPNRCLMLYVKNYGFHQHVSLLPSTIIEQLDAVKLCEEEVKIRDHRKSSLKYELG